MNTSLKVEKMTSDHQSKGEDGKCIDLLAGPSSLLVKKYGGNVFSEKAEGYLNSSLHQALIFYEQSVRGWGPKLYGLLEDGRVEEYVDCHTLTPEEAFTPEFSRDIAKAYARFHSLKLPIKKGNPNILLHTEPTINSCKKGTEIFLASGKLEDTELIESYKKLFEFPIGDEIGWLNCLFEKIKQRTVMCTMDPNYLNRLVRNQKPSDPNATRVVLIDFDLSKYADRGYDLAGHFVNRMFCWSGKDTKVSGAEYPSEEERVAFLSAYLEEAEELFDDFDRNSLDSLENLIQETDVYAMVFCMTLMPLAFMLPSVLEKEPKMGTFIDPLLNIYSQLKQEFCLKYSQLVMN